MADKFLNTSGSGKVNLSNGTTNIYAAKLAAANLNPSRPIKTNAVRELVSQNLDISDVNNLQSELTTKQEISFINNDTHANPPAGQTKLYVKTDGNVYKKDSAGTESGLGGSAEKLILVGRTTDIDYSENVKLFTYSDNTLNTHNFYDYTSIPTKPDLRQAFEPTVAPTNVASEAELDTAISTQASNIVITASFTITTQKVIGHSCKITQSSGLSFTSSVDTPFTITGDNTTIDGLQIINNRTSSIVSCLNFNNLVAINNTVRNCIFTTNEFGIVSNNAQIQIHNCQFKFTGTADSHRYIHLTKITGKTLIYSNIFESNGAFSTACLLVNGTAINYKDGSLIVYNNTSSNGTIQRMGIMELIPDSNFTLSFIQNTIETFTDFFILYVGNNPLAGFKEIILYKNNVSLVAGSTGFKGLIGIDSFTTGNNINTSTIIRASQNTLPTQFRVDYSFIPQSSATNPLMMYRPDKFNLTISPILINPPLVSYYDDTDNSENTNITALQNKTQNINATLTNANLTSFDEPIEIRTSTSFDNQFNFQDTSNTREQGAVGFVAGNGTNGTKWIIGGVGDLNDVIFRTYTANDVIKIETQSTATVKINTNGTLQLERPGVYTGTVDALLKLNTNGTLEKSNATLTTTGDLTTSGFINSTQYKISGNNGVLLKTPNTSNLVAGNGAATFLQNGTENVIIGTNAGRDITDASNSVIIGRLAGQHIQGTVGTPAEGNTAIGYESQFGQAALTTGQFNTSVGAFSLYNITSGSQNTAIGTSAGFNLTTGGRNTLIGFQTADGVAVMNDCSSLGYKATPGSGTNRNAIGTFATCDADNQICLGNNSTTQIINTGSNICDLGASNHQFKNIYYSGDLYKNNIKVGLPVLEMLVWTGNFATQATRYLEPYSGNGTTGANLRNQISPLKNIKITYALARKSNSSPTTQFILYKSDGAFNNLVDLQTITISSGSLVDASNLNINITEFETLWCRTLSSGSGNPQDVQFTINYIQT